MSELIPPDLSQCQVEKPNGATIWSLGGSPKLIRCTNKPEYIATEIEKGLDGLRGSMSLCSDCRDVFLKQMGDYPVMFTKIKFK